MNHQDKLIADNANDLGEVLRDLRKQREELKAEQKQTPSPRQRLSPKEREEILKKTDGRCHICGGKIEGTWHADHVMAHSGGGLHSIENYLPAHSLCNNYRWDYLPEECQLLMKLGIWCRKQIENQTILGQDVGHGFLQHERRRLGRRKS